MSKKLHIFYMEDEESVLNYWSQILSLENYRVTKASDAQDAMNEIKRFIEKREVVDYFLLDIMIIPWKPFSKEETLYGYLTGFKIANYILSNYKEINDNFKIIFFTVIMGVKGERIKEEVEKYLKENEDICSLITKPTKFKDLRKLLS